MKAESVINYLLTHDAPLVALLSENIYPLVLPVGLSPTHYAVYRLVSNVQQSTIDALSNFNLYKARLQVNLAASTYAGLKTLVQAACDACSRKSGMINGVKVVSCMLALVGPDDYESSTGFFVQSVDFQIFYHAFEVDVVINEGVQPVNQDFATPLVSWHVMHNKGYEPLVSVFDIFGNVIFASVRHNSVNEFFVEFSAPTAGSVTYF